MLFLVKIQCALPKLSASAVVNFHAALAALHSSAAGLQNTLPTLVLEMRRKGVMFCGPRQELEA